MKCCFQAEVVHLKYMVWGLSGRRHLAQIQNKLDVSMAHKKVKKLYVYIFPTLTFFQLSPVQAESEVVCHGACVGLC